MTQNSLGRTYGRRRQAEPVEQARRHRPDYWLIVIVIFLVAIGLVVVYAISPALSATGGGSGSHYVSRQIIAIVLSIIAFLVTARIPLATWQRWQKPLLIAAAVGTLVALITPLVPQYPAHRWIRIGGLSLQSVELVKFALLISLGGFLAARSQEGQLDNFKRTFQPLIITFIVIGFFVAGIQSDLGSTGVIIAMMGAMAFIVGMPLRRLAVIVALVAILLVLAVGTSSYRRDRVLTFLHPASNCLTTGYQVCQALTTTGSGGLIGKGVGGGAASYGYVPEAQNDSIFAIYAEKFGFVGCCVLLGLFTVLFARLRMIIERSADVFSRLIVTGILAWLSTQTLINVGAMLGLLPLKGITLPFISYGGTSVLFVGAAMGLVFQVSHYTSLGSRGVMAKNQQRSTYEGSDDRGRLRRAYHPNPSSRA